MPTTISIPGLYDLTGEYHDSPPLGAGDAQIIIGETISATTNAPYQPSSLSPTIAVDLTTAEEVEGAEIVFVDQTNPVAWEWSGRVYIDGDEVSGGGSGTIGSGSIEYPLTLKSDAGNPVPDVACWISTDIVGADVIAGTNYTDNFGNTKFMLDAGTYYLWRQSSGWNFPNPITIQVI